MDKDRKWIRICGILVIVLWICLWGSGCGKRCDLDNVKQETTDEWKEQSSTRVVSQTYVDDKGNQIVYYCCEIKGESVEAERVWETVIDMETVTQRQECYINDWPGILCRNARRSYLCWIISPRYSCILEYDASAVAEEDIFRMAASVVFVEED